MKKIRKSILNLNPLTKMLAVIIFGVVSLVSTSYWTGLVILLLLTILSIFVLHFRGFIKLLIGFGVPLCAMLVFIHGCYGTENRHILLDVGFIQIGLEGTLYALKLSSVILVFICSFFLMNKTTKNSELAAALTQAGLSSKFEYLFLASLNVVPLMNKKIKMIKEAQMARGMRVGGNLIHRLRTFVPIIGPAILSSFIDAQERGMTLEIRGFGIKNKKPTPFLVIKTRKIDYVLRILLFLILVFAVVDRALF